MIRVLAVLLSLVSMPGPGPRRDVSSLMSLSRTAGGSIELTEDHVARSVDFELPSDAHQGPSTWYLLRLHATITMRRDTRDGVAYLTAATNGRVAAMIEIDADPSRRQLDYSYLDLINGSTRGTESSDHVTVSLRNYLQVEGVRPGTNTLRFDLTVRRGAQIERAVIEQDSGVDQTDESPFVVSTTGQVSTRTAPVGTVIRVPFVLGTDGSRYSRELLVAPLETAGIRPLDTKPARVAFDAKGRYAGQLRFRAAGVGRRLIRIRITGPRVMPRVRTLGTVVVVPSGTRGTGPAWFVAAALAAIGGGLLVAAGRARRSRAKLHDLVP